MPDLTPNMGLEKPLDNETADIQVINNNMDKIDTAFADSAGKSQEIIDLIGKNNDAAGTNTLFSRLTQLANYVDALENLLGLNTDAAGTKSIFARLAQITAYVDTLEASLGQVNDPMNINGSVHAKIKEARDLLAWVSACIGDNSNGPHPEGSVHAKLKDIKNTITASTDWTKQKPRAAVLPNTSIPVGGTADVVNITGRGYFLSLIGMFSMSLSPVIVIDGIKVLSERERMYYSNEHSTESYSGPFRFNSSLRVYIQRAANASQSAFIDASVLYSLD